MLIQSDKMYGYIFPLAVAVLKAPNVYEYEELIGTGFVIGKNGFAMTAAHVLEQMQELLKTSEHRMVALFRSESHWHPFEITGYEKHPTEDAGLFKISGGPWQSFLSIAAEPEYQGCEFCCYGYPHNVAKEGKFLAKDGLDNPELTYIQGYIRRRISKELPVTMLRGDQFYELSETIGHGMSGAPIIKKPIDPNQNYKVIGIYFGEKSEGDISYAVRAEAFAHWTPAILGKSILEENTAFTVL